MPKLLTGRRRQVCALRDACLMLVARHGLASRQSGGAPVTEVVLDRFRIWLTPSGGRRELEVWYASAAGARVLSLWWSGSGEDFTVVGFRRGAWEQELLALDARGASPA
jgi:hypothetical protein